MKISAVIAKDSGGVQMEAFFYQVPCVTHAVQQIVARLAQDLLA